MDGVYRLTPFVVREYYFSLTSAAFEKFLGSFPYSITTREPVDRRPPSGRKSEDERRREGTHLTY